MQGILLLAVVLFADMAVAFGKENGHEKPFPLYAFCGTGDHLWVRQREPVDSPATIRAMTEWMSRTYGINRLYWRGGQSMMWDQYVKVGKETSLQYDWTAWKHHLYNDLKINQAAAAACQHRGMEFFLYSGLFEFGVQPDIGIVGPYLFEDTLRIGHPEWCAMDRWSERRCPGPISFCYPEVRKIVVDRYVDNVERFHYDGVTFYTYVENCGIRYEDEFGYNLPVLAEFSKRYPGVDPREKPLTPAQKLWWYRCRGRFVTDFLRELHSRLAPKKKTLCMILDAVEPDFTQPWWGKKLRGTGRIYLDWRAWVREGIVDELWVQLAATKDQTRTLDLVLQACAGTPVKITVRATDPFDPVWRPYIARGVTPVAVITWARNGIERFCLEPASATTLRSSDWRLRLQTVNDVETGKLVLEMDGVAALAGDPDVLVRRRVMFAIAARKDAAHVDVLERGLADPESSVRIAAAGALATVHGPRSAEAIFRALGQHGYFQMKEACVDALAAMGTEVLPLLRQAATGPVYAGREVAVRALYVIGRDHETKGVYAPLRRAMRDDNEDDRVRYHAITSLVGLRQKIGSAQQRELVSDLRALAAADVAATVRLRAAWGLGYFHGLSTTEERQATLDILQRRFRMYGDGCCLPDAAFGWRVVGNAMLQYHAAGRDALEAMRTQPEDKWLAWIAYEVRYVPHRLARIVPVEETKALDIHRKYAPSFPGYRSW